MAGLPPLETPRTRDDDEAVRKEREREALREGINVGVQSILKTGLPAVVLLPLVIFAMRESIESANQIFASGAGENFTDALMPAVLLGMFGAVHGAFAGWRLSSGAGLVGWYGWLLGAAAVVALAGVGAVASFVIFDEFPGLIWLCLAVMAACGLGGITYFTRMVE